MADKKDPTLHGFDAATILAVGSKNKNAAERNEAMRKLMLTQLETRKVLPQSKGTAFESLFAKGGGGVPKEKLEEVAGITFASILDAFLAYASPTEVKSYGDLVKSITTTSDKSGAQAALNRMVAMVRDNLQARDIIMVRKGRSGGIALNPGFDRERGEIVTK